MFAFTNAVQELAVWRKQATISVQEEFVGRTLGRVEQVEIEVGAARQPVLRREAR